MVHYRLLLFCFLFSACEKFQVSCSWTETNKDIQGNNCSTGPNQCALPWQYCNETNGCCYCGNTLYDVMKCTPNKLTSVLTCHCATYDQFNGLTEVGSCIYHCQSILNRTGYGVIYHALPNNVSELNDNVCEPFNRNGTLCGKCKDGFHPLAYSFDMSCVKCQHSKSNWWKFLLAAFLPLTLFYLIILVFNVNITSSNLFGFVYYSQVVATPAFARLIYLLTKDKPNIRIPVKLIGLMYGIWNLDFFRSLNLGICLDIDTLQTLALNLAVGIYPLLLMMLSYLLIGLYDRNFKLLVILWRPFHTVLSHFHRNWEIRTSVIDSFATFFLLSNVNILSAACDLLAPVTVHQINSTGHLTHSLRLFYDATIDYLGMKHLPYAVLAIAVCIIFVLFPVLILMLYPFNWFQKFLNIFPFRWNVLHTFMDSFQGCYKDGTEVGTRDYRWFASTFFIARFLMLVVGAISLDSSFFPIASILYALLAAALIGIQPFKTSTSHYTAINAIFVLLISLLYVSLTGMIKADINMPRLSKCFAFVALISAILPLLYISVIILHWMYSHRKFGLQLIQQFYTRRL